MHFENLKCTLYTVKCNFIENGWCYAFFSAAPNFCASMIIANIINSSYDVLYRSFNLFATTAFAYYFIFLQPVFKNRKFSLIKSQK